MGRLLAFTMVGIAAGFMLGFFMFRVKQRWCRVCGATLRCPECAPRHSMRFSPTGPAGVPGAAGAGRAGAVGRAAVDAARVNRGRWSQ
ncbi:hypothetical protein O7621_12065 [Solwaraspora sp. WMMD937]|uniref:hypothetical protein n=1 Tax=Solwaraspora sp. WMMD937 TaxID=3016090 RepID=UPI00249B788F|nr:hypothetical protein [Solwaraspora sp. WMMD937]WFE23935.1 hypothetical protein O7621_12065 [Solwaraspora sp. WMMD937]